MPMDAGVLTEAIKAAIKVKIAAADLASAADKHDAWAGALGAAIAEEVIAHIQSFAVVTSALDPPGATGIGACAAGGGPVTLVVGTATSTSVL